MGCLPTKHVGNSPRSLGAHEAVALAAESSCEKLDLPDFPNIATGTPCENLTPLCRRKIAASNLSIDACHAMISAQFHVLVFVEFMLKMQSADFSLKCVWEHGSQYVSSAECRLEPCSPFLRLL
jgi:hypothetical protein